MTRVATRRTARERLRAEPRLERPHGYWLVQHYGQCGESCGPSVLSCAWSYEAAASNAVLQLCYGDAQQYWKVQRAFAMVRHYEHTRGARFEWLLRMRTDVYIFGTFPPLEQLSPNQVHVPVGMVNPGVALNDHIAIVPRELGAGYFDSADELSCNSSLHTRGLNGRLQSKPQTFWRDRLQALGLNMSQFELKYVLLRSGLGAECSRILSHKRTVPWWYECLRLARVIPVYCIGSDGLGRPNTAFGEWLNETAFASLPSRARPLSYVNAPKCSDLPRDAIATEMQQSYLRKPWPPSLRCE